MMKIYKKTKTKKEFKQIIATKKPKTKPKNNKKKKKDLNNIDMNRNKFNTQSKT